MRETCTELSATLKGPNRSHVKNAPKDVARLAALYVRCTALGHSVSFWVSRPSDEVVGATIDTETGSLIDTFEEGAIWGLGRSPQPRWRRGGTRRTGRCAATSQTSTKCPGFSSSPILHSTHRSPIDSRSAKVQTPTKSWPEPVALLTTRLLALTAGDWVPNRLFPQSPLIGVRSGVTCADRGR